MPEVTPLEELKKSIHDLTAKVKEGITPKETLVTMVNDAVASNLAAARTPAEETHRFDEVPEPKSLVRKFNIKSIHDVCRADNTRTNLFGHPQIVKDSYGIRTLAMKDERLTEIQTAIDDVMLVHTAMCAAGPAEYKELARRDPRAAIKGLKSFDRVDRLTEGLKAVMDTGTATEGLEWIPTDFSSQLTDAIMLQHIVAGLFPLIRMPTEPYTIPTQTAKPIASVVGEGAAATDTNFGASIATTANKSLASVIMKSFVDFTEEITEDSIIPMIPFVRGWVSKALLRAEETMIINGDATGGHMDSDTTAAEDPRKALDGLRQFAGSNIYNTTNPSPFTADMIRNTRALLSPGFRENPSDLAYITSGLGLLNFIQIAEVLTLDKFGPAATILNGQIGAIDGSPIIISEHVREDLNATGVYDGVTTNLTIFLAVHLPSFVRGTKRDPRVETDRDIKTGVNTMAISQRRGFLDLQDSATFDNCAIGYNFN